VATIDLFVSILAAEAGNLAVKVLATGGVYLAGGVAVHTLQVIKQPAFLQRFKRKGRFAELMGRIPIHVVVTPAGLAGAAAFGLETSTGDS
jgi:glucokinase